MFGLTVRDKSSALFMFGVTVLHIKGQMKLKFAALYVDKFINYIFNKLIMILIIHILLYMYVLILVINMSSSNFIIRLIGFNFL
jgi:hypothetical protein